MVDQATIARLAQDLHAARLTGRECLPLIQSTPGLDPNDGYRIMRAGIELRLAAGENFIGWKMGLTSQAKRQQMNLDTPIYGVLTDRMRIADGGTFTVGAGIHPKIEPEIVFIIGRPLSGTVTREEALAACSAVHTGLEILDSRYVGFKYFSLPDVIADNSSSSHFIISAESRPPAGLALDKLQMRMSVNGKVVESAESSAISGHPVDSIVQLCALLAQNGQGLKPGEIVLAGAATTAVMLQPGYAVQLDVDELPSVRVHAV